MNFFESICWIEVMFSAELVVSSTKVVESFTAISGHGVWLVAGKSLKDGGSCQFPPKFI